MNKLSPIVLIRTMIKYNFSSIDLIDLILLQNSTHLVAPLINQFYINCLKIIYLNPKYPKYSCSRSNNLRAWYSYLCFAMR